MRLPLIAPCPQNPLEPGVSLPPMFPRSGFPAPSRGCDSGSGSLPTPANAGSRCRTRCSCLSPRAPRRAARCGLRAPSLSSPPRPPLREERRQRATPLSRSGRPGLTTRPVPALTDPRPSRSPSLCRCRALPPEPLRRDRVPSGAGGTRGGEGRVRSGAGERAAAGGGGGSRPPGALAAVLRGTESSGGVSRSSSSSPSSSSSLSLPPAPVRQTPPAAAARSPRPAPAAGSAVGGGEGGETLVIDRHARVPIPCCGPAAGT